MLGLYESAIASLEGAERAFQTRTPAGAEEFHNHLISGQKAMHELIAGLNLRCGGETAAHLFRMYDFINYQLVRANIMKEVGGLLEARTLLCKLRERVTSAL